MNSTDLEAWLKNRFGDRGAVVGICGLPGSGKSTLVHELKKAFTPSGIEINLDDFCIAATPVRKSFLQGALVNQDLTRLRMLAAPENPADNPWADPVSWYDWKAAAAAISSLKEGKVVTRAKAWNQATGLCDKQVEYVPPQGTPGFYFLDCVYLFEKPLRPLIDVFVLIDRPAEESFAREAQRDSHRNTDTYARYKKIVTDLYCVPYLERHRADMDCVIK